MRKLAGADTPRRKLTAKQSKFVAGVMGGLDSTAAYRGAYDASNMLPSTVHEEASRLRRNPDIAASISSLEKEAESRLIDEGERLRGLVLSRLEAEAIDENNPGAVRCGALVALGKTALVGLFEEQRKPEAETTEIKGMLATALARLLERDRPTTPAALQIEPPAASTRDGNRKTASDGIPH